MELMAEWQWKRWDAVARRGAGKLTLQEVRPCGTGSTLDRVLGECRRDVGR